MQPQTRESLNEQIRSLEIEVRIQYKRFSDDPAFLFALRWLGDVGRQLQVSLPNLKVIRELGADMERYVPQQPDLASTPTGARLRAFAAELSGLQEIFYPAPPPGEWWRGYSIVGLLAIPVVTWALLVWVLPPGNQRGLATILLFIIIGATLLSAVVFWLRRLK